MNNSEKRVIIYCRESRDDGFENYERIETQRDMLINYCKTEGYVNIVDIILDDDMTGTSFKRFDNIIKRVKNKEIDAILFKDSSRLGRNLKESLNFIALMEECNVEVLFANEEYNEDFFPLFAWFNEQRAKEDSKKIKNVFKHKMSNGELLIKAIYGYTKIDNQLIVNEEQAKVVRKIFDLFINGYGTSEIATILNTTSNPTPSQSLNLPQQTSIWNKQHIVRIINNEAYTGCMFYSKSEKKNFKTKKKIYKQKTDWIKIENHHEAIISKETFESAEKLRIRIGKLKSRTTINRPFSGILFCGRCNSRLILRIRRNRKDSYICGKNQKEGAIKNEIRENYGCTTHHIREEELYDLVSNRILFLLNSSDNNISSNIIYGQKINMNNNENTIKGLLNEIDKFKKIINQIYDDKLNDKISNELFDSKYKEYNNKIQTLNNTINDIKNKNNDKPNITAKTLKELYKKVKDKTITKMQLQILLEKIIIYDKFEIDDIDKKEYDVDDESYDYIYNNGGLLFIDNFSHIIKD